MHAMMRKFTLWLLRGSEEQFLHKEWLANENRLSHYQIWTEAQKLGMVTKDTETTKREAFWKDLPQ